MALFIEGIDNGNFLEYEEVYPDVFYGTLKSELDKIIKSGKKLVLDIDVLGALNIKKIYGDISAKKSNCFYPLAALLVFSFGKRLC